MSETTVITKDALNEQIELVRRDGTGALALTNRGRVLIRLLDTLGTDGNWHTVSIREVDICVAGVPKKMLVLGSAPY